jgi:hypothetical protein
VAVPLKTSHSFGKWVQSQVGRFKTHPRKNEIECVILFCAGFLEDGILSFDTIVTANHYWLPAGLTSYLVVLMQFSVFPFIIEDRMLVNWMKLNALGLGCAFGAMLAVAFGPQ